MTAPEISSVGVEDVVAYVRKKGWNPVQTTHPRLMEFHGPHGLVLVLPNRNDFVDTPRRLEEAVGLLAAVEETTPDRIIQAIATMDRDVLAQRFLGNNPGNGIVSLEAATRIVLGLRNLVGFAACVEEDPKPYFAKATKLARQYTEWCRFGHTFPGSFGFTVEMPLPPSAGLPGVPPPPPWERRVMERIVRGLDLIQTSVLQGDPGILINQFPQGFNANMYEVLLALGETMDGVEFEFTVTWSPEWAVSPDLVPFKIARVGRKSYQHFETAAKALRKAGESAETEVKGRIVQLRAEAPPEAEQEDDEEGPASERTVTVLWEDKSGRRLHIRVPLEFEEYRDACDAHRDGKFVTVNGKIEKLGKFWQLMGPTGFRVEGER